MAVRSKSRPAAPAKKSAPAKASAKFAKKGASSLGKKLQVAVKAVKAAGKALAAKPASKATIVKAAGKVPATGKLPVAQGQEKKNAGSATVGQEGKRGKTGKPGKQGKNSNALAVERVTERLMGRVAAEPAFDTVCREVACEGLGTSAGYCRLHYIKNWKKIKRKEVILKEGKLNQYIEELVAKYPEKYIEAIRQDLANDKEFAKVIVDLDLDENDEDFEAEGTSPDADVSIDSLKREFEEEPDAF